MGALALALCAGLLLAAYFALTRLIVRPLDALARAAERVALGARRFSVPQGGARELAELGANLHIMTEHLIREEEALRAKVDEPFERKLVHNVRGVGYVLEERS